MLRDSKEPPRQSRAEALPSSPNRIPTLLVVLSLETTSSVEMGIFREPKTSFHAVSLKQEEGGEVKLIPESECTGPSWAAHFSLRGQPCSWAEGNEAVWSLLGGQGSG